MIRGANRARTTSRRGAVVVFTVIAMAVLLGILGLVVDGGYMYLMRERAQAAADASALAAAVQIPAGLQQMRDAANLMAQKNPEGGNAITTTVTPNFGGDSTKVEIVNTTYFQPFFLGLVGAGKVVKITNRSVAQYAPGGATTVNPWTVAGGLYGALSVTFSGSGGTSSGDDGHSGDGHSDDGHSDDGHSDDGHSDDGHSDDGHSDDGHSDDGHSDDGHSDDGHDGDDDGHSEDGHSEDGHGGDDDGHDCDDDGHSIGTGAESFGAIGNVTSSGSVTLSGTGTINGTITAKTTLTGSGASTVTGNVLAGGNVSLSGGLSVGGNVVSNGTVSSSGATIGGSTTTSAARTIPSVSLPAIPMTEPAASNNNAAVPATFRTGSPPAVTVGSGKTLTLAAGTYYFSSLSLAESSTLKVSSGPVKIYVTGNTTFANSATINNSTNSSNNLQMFVNGTGDITWKGSTPLYAGIYAPNANITVDGSGAIHGNLLSGKNLTNSGTGTIYVDTNISSSWATSSALPKVARLIQ